MLEKILDGLLPVFLITLLMTIGLSAVQLGLRSIPRSRKHIPRLMQIKFRLFNLVVTLFNMNLHEERLFLRYRRYCEEWLYSRFMADFRRLDNERQEKVVDDMKRMGKGAWRPYRKEHIK